MLRRNQDDALYAEIGTTTTNSYTDATAVVAQGYAYKVQASNDSGDSEFSEHVLAMIVPPAPDAPTGFEAVVGEDSVTLSWDASDDDTITSYTVIRQVRDADPPQTVLLRLDSGETNQVTDSSPEAGAAYTYSVMAINAGGRSEAATVDVDIPAAESDAEAAPTGLSATVSRRLHGGPRLGRGGGRHRLQRAAPGPRRDGTHPACRAHHQLPTPTAR